MPAIVQDDALLLHRGEAGAGAALDALRDLGADWVRVTAGWSAMAPRDGPGPLDFGPLDRVARLAAERGLRLNVDLAFWAPGWAVARRTGDGRERWAPDPALFADFAEQVARRLPQAAAFTVWNEPNHPVFLLPQWQRAGARWVPAAPRVYRALLRAAVPRIRAAAPDALVLVGATSSIGAARPDGVRDRMSPMTFLRALACVDERLDPVAGGDCAGYTPLPGDGWSHHPYPLRLAPWAPSPNPEDVRMGDLPRLRDALAELHRRGRFEERMDVWVTEFGYQTDPPDPTAPVSLGRHARWLAAAEFVARDAGARSVSQFLLQDLPERPGPTLRARWGDYQSGLRDPAGRPKPAQAAWARPLDVVVTGPGRARARGLVRPGAGAREVRLRRGTEVVAQARTDAEGRVDLPVPHAAGDTYALDVRGRDGWSEGLPVQPRRP